MSPRTWSILSRVLNWFRLLGKRNHHYHIRRARKTLARLAEIRGNGAAEGQVLAYLRKVDPSTFEELILEIAERAGCWVMRNRSYSGDGGIDGRFRTTASGTQGRWIVQAKRYSDAINPQHVRDFAALLGRHNDAAGLFVHTGRTGIQSREAAQGAEILILSGFQLAQLAAGEQDLLALLERHRGIAGIKQKLGLSTQNHLF